MEESLLEALMGVLPVVVGVMMLLGILAGIFNFKSNRGEKEEEEGEEGEEVVKPSALDKEIERVKSSQKKRSLFGIKF